MFWQGLRDPFVADEGGRMPEGTQAKPLAGWGLMGFWLPCLIPKLRCFLPLFLANSSPRISP